MKVLVSGARGLIGAALTERLTAAGHVVHRLVRRPPRQDGEILWDPRARRFGEVAAEGSDAVVHLAGENVASGRWTAERKAEIRESRVTGTRFLAESLAKLERAPRAFLCASAIGFYGGSAEGEFTESSGPGDGFLAAVCRDWEAACEPAAARGVRVVHLRFGLVLSRNGGALARMLPAFRLGLGGRVGDGRQWVSWIALDDAARAVEGLLDDQGFRGPVNVVSPEPVRQAEFARSLAAALNRPALLPMPAFLLRALLGEMADEMLLVGSRVKPGRLMERGFAWQHSDLAGALRSLLAP